VSNALQAVLAAVDEANSGDPHKVDYEGRPVGKEWLYGQRMSAMLAEYAPDASESLQIAARAQHICRWLSPRSDYPMDRPGYLRWRSELGKMHARLAGEIMAEKGYPEAQIARVGQLLRKEKLKRDAEVQTLEDVICLVFIKYYFEEFAAEHPHEKVLSVVQKTWNKMSERGHQAALALDLPAPVSAQLQAALG